MEDPLQYRAIGVYVLSDEIATAHGALSGIYIVTNDDYIKLGGLAH